MNIVAGATAFRLFYPYKNISVHTNVKEGAGPRGRQKLTADFFFFGSACGIILFCCFIERHDTCCKEISSFLLLPTRRIAR